LKRYGPTPAISQGFRISGLTTSGLTCDVSTATLRQVPPLNLPPQRQQQITVGGLLLAALGTASLQV
jgi:hypothetical protein